MTTNKALVEYADGVDEAVRMMCHATISRTATEAPLVYDLMGHLSSAAHRLAELTEHLSRGLEGSLAEFDVYDRNRDPAESVAMAKEQFAIATYAARTLGEALGKVQSAINLQGYNVKDDKSTAPASFGEVLDDLLENGDQE